MINELKGTWVVNEVASTIKDKTDFHAQYLPALNSEITAKLDVKASQLILTMDGGDREKIFEPMGNTWNVKHVQHMNGKRTVTNCCSAMKIATKVATASMASTSKEVLRLFPLRVATLTWKCPARLVAACKLLKMPASMAR